MAWKPTYFIVFPYEMSSQINWPNEWKHQCTANISLMLRDVLKVSTIGSEIKLIWNQAHRTDMLMKNDISDELLDDYLKSDCSMLSFLSKGTMNRAATALRGFGCENFVCVSSYRDMILQQAFYRRNKKFLEK